MVTDFPALPLGQSWHVSANHANRELVVQLINTWPGDSGLPPIMAERRTHLHWDTNQIRHAVVDAMNGILHDNATHAKVDAFLKKLEAEANNQ